jgi:hypothetical protein
MASAAAALTARAKRQIQHQFFRADAVRPDRPIGFSPANGFERRQFARYQSAGVVHEVAPGQYWLDVVAYDVVLRRRHERVRLALLLVIVALLLVTFWGTLSAPLR